MNGSLAELPALVRGVCDGVADLEGVDVAICPPNVYLSKVIDLATGSAVEVGAQNLAAEPPGAYTGETAGEMLTDLGCALVLVGHSERRTLYGENNELVGRKFVRALECGLKPVLCIGETQAERESEQTEDVVGAQLDAVLQTAGAAGVEAGVIAYEPVWAIGTGLTASPEQAQAVHAFIRERIAAMSKPVAEGVRILYGGSVKPGNAAQLCQMPDIDGGLIGGAALVAEDFVGICQATVN